MSSDDDALTFEEEGIPIATTAAASDLAFVDGSAYPTATMADKEGLEAFLDGDDNIAAQDSKPLLGGEGAAAASGGVGSGLLAGVMACLPQMGCLQQLFDVDTADVRDRVLKVVHPEELKGLLKFPPSNTVRSSSFLSLVVKKPDAYGPFWIAATLVFMIGVCSNVAGWLNVSPKTSVEQATAAVSAYDGDVTKLTGALTLVAFFAIAIPVGMWGLARAWGVTHLAGSSAAPDIEAAVAGGGDRTLTIMTFVCLYGYSLIFLLAACIVMALPVLGMGWLGILGGFALWTATVVHEVWPAIAAITGTEANPPGKAPMYCGLVAAANAVFCLTIKLFYF